MTQLAQAFRQVKPYIVRIEKQAATDPSPTIATGVVFAVRSSRTSFYVATAAHVFKETRDVPVHVKLWRDEYPDRVIEWDIVKGEINRTIGFVYTTGNADAGVLNLPMNCSNGEAFLNNDESFAPHMTSHAVPDQTSDLAQIPLTHLINHTDAPRTVRG